MIGLGAVAELIGPGVPVPRQDSSPGPIDHLYDELVERIYDEELPHHTRGFDDLIEREGLLEAFDLLTEIMPVNTPDERKRLEVAPR